LWQSTRRSVRIFFRLSRGEARGVPRARECASGFEFRGSRGVPSRRHRRRGRGPCRWRPPWPRTPSQLRVGTGRGEVVRCGRAVHENENESSRVSVERRYGRVPSEIRAPRVRGRVRTVAEVLNRRHVVRCACAACVEVRARELQSRENKNRDRVSPRSGRSGRTTKSRAKDVPEIGGRPSRVSARRGGFFRFAARVRARVVTPLICTTLSSAASPAARRRSRRPPSPWAPGSWPA
jgi:hypothetical protein